MVHFDFPIVYQTFCVGGPFSEHFAPAPEELRITMHVVPRVLWGRETSEETPYHYQSWKCQSDSYVVKITVVVAFEFRLWEPEQNIALQPLASHVLANV